MYVYVLNQLEGSVLVLCHLQDWRKNLKTVVSYFNLISCYSHCLLQFCLPEICKVTVNAEKITAHGQVYVMYKYLNVSTSVVSEDLIIHYWIDLCIYNCIITETLLRVVISSHVCKWILFWPSPAPSPVLCSMAVFLVHVMKAYGGEQKYSSIQS